MSGAASARDDRPLLTVSELAVRLSVSKSMAFKLVATGAIPAVRIGRSVRIFPADLDAYLAESKR